MPGKGGLGMMVWYWICLVIGVTGTGYGIKEIIDIVRESKKN